MKDYKALIRLNRWKVDEKSRALAELQAEAQRLADIEADLLVKLEEERIAARSSLEAGALFGPYAYGVAQQRRKLEVERARVERHIEIARDELRLAMGEVKKFEIAEANAQARKAAQEKAKEDQALDEIALTGFRRREE